MQRFQFAFICLLGGALAVGPSGADALISMPQEDPMQVEKFVISWGAEVAAFESDVSILLRGKSNAYSPVAEGVVRVYGDGTIYYGLNFTQSPISSSSVTATSPEKTGTEKVSVKFFRRGKALAIHGNDGKWVKITIGDCKPSQGRVGSVETFELTSKPLLAAVGGDETVCSMRARLVQDAAFVPDPRRLISGKGEEDLFAFSVGGKGGVIEVSLLDEKAAELSGFVQVSAARLSLTRNNSKKVEGADLRMHLEGNVAKKKTEEYWDISVQYKDMRELSNSEISKEVSALLDENGNGH